MKKYYSVYLDETLVDKIDDIAKKEERSRNFIIKELLEAALKKTNDI